MICAEEFKSEITDFFGIAGFDRLGVKKVSSGVGWGKDSGSGVSREYIIDDVRLEVVVVTVGDDDSDDILK